MSTLKSRAVVADLHPHSVPVDHAPVTEHEDEYDDEGPEEESTGWIGGSTAAKFLLAGGIAGAGKFQTTQIS